MKYSFWFLISLSILPWKEKKNSEKNTITQVNYELVSNWPELGNGYRLSQPTGIGIDKNDHLFVFHRAGRKWTTPLRRRWCSIMIKHLF